MKFGIQEFFLSSEKIHVSLKSDKNNGHFTWRPMYIYDSISLNSSYNEKCFKVVDEIKIHIVGSLTFFSKNGVVYARI